MVRNANFLHRFGALKILPYLFEYEGKSYPQVRFERSDAEQAIETTKTVDNTGPIRFERSDAEQAIETG